MWFLIAILVIAASPVILLLVFSEIMADKEGSKINDSPRKISKILAWVLFALFSLFLLYLVFEDNSRRRHYRDAINIIIFFFDFLK